MRGADQTITIMTSIYHYYYRVSHGIGPTLFFAILSASTILKYKNLVSVKKFRKFAIR